MASVVSRALITLAELKTALGISSVTEDAKLEQALNHAADRVEREADRSLRTADYVERYDGPGGRALLLRHFPASSVSAVAIAGIAQTLWTSEADGEPTTKDVVVLVSADPVIGTNALWRDGGWPSGIRNVKVTWTAGYGGLRAALTTALAGAQNDLVFTAVQGGSGGNAITVTYVVAGLNTVLSVTVVGLAITVNVATNGAGAATSTAATVRNAILASAPAAALVSVELKAGEDGTGVVTALAVTALAGGGADTASPIPEDLKEATIYLAAVAYKRRDMGSWDSTALSLAGQSITLDPDRLLRRASDLIAKYRRPEALVA